MCALTPPRGQAHRIGRLRLVACDWLSSYQGGAEFGENLSPPHHPFLKLEKEVVQVADNQAEALKRKEAERSAALARLNAAKRAPYSRAAGEELKAAQDAYNKVNR